MLDEKTRQRMRVWVRWAFLGTLTSTAAFGGSILLRKCSRLVSITNNYYGVQPEPPSSSPTTAPTSWEETWSDRRFNCNAGDPCSLTEDGDGCSHNGELLTCHKGRWVQEDGMPPEQAPSPRCTPGRRCSNRGNPDAYCMDISGRHLLCCFHTLMFTPSSGHCPTRM